MQTIYLRIDEKHEIPKLYAKQRDVGRKFKVVITDGNDNYKIPNGAQLSVWYSGTSGEGHYTSIGENSAILVEGNTVTVEMIAQMLANKGGGNLCLAINTEEGKQLGLWDIPYIVEAIPGADSETAQECYNAFAATVAGALDAAERAENAVKTLVPDTTLSISGGVADAAAVGTALAGKAPSGYGLGDPQTGELEKLDHYKQPGWYRFAGSFAVYNHTVSAFYMHVTAWDANNCTQTAFLVYSGTPVIRRHCYGGNWQPWEWENPPMSIGIEYRTTERWNGKPVYKKLVNMGTLPASGLTFVDTGIDKKYRIIDTSITFRGISDGYTRTRTQDNFDFAFTYDYFVTIGLSIEVSADYSVYTGEMLISYVEI